jgi:hypothetical protein
MSMLPLETLEDESVGASTMRRAMHVVLALCAISSTTHTAAKEEPELTNPLHILRKADSAIKAVTMVRYKATYKETGALESGTPAVEGTVVISGWFNNAIQKFRCDAKVRLPGSNEVKSVTVGSDHQAFYLIDRETKKAHVGIGLPVMGRYGGVVRNLLLVEFVHVRPFDDEINGKEKELKGSVKIGNEDCYEVSVVYDTPRHQQATWYFSKKDFLPRGLYRTYSASDDGPGQRWTLTEVEVDPVYLKDPFPLRLPDGYTRTDEPAP